MNEWAALWLGLAFFFSVGAVCELLAKIYGV